MAYKFSETGKLGDKFQRVFGIGFKPFYDGLMSVASKQLCIDIMKFDEWLHEKHGNYEDAGQSMDDCIREHYGEEGVKLINEVIGADGDNPAPEPESEPEKPKKKPKTKTKGKANVKKITEKMLNEKGSIKFECTDSYGITYEMTLFQMGLVMLGRVLAQDGTLLYHNEQSCEDCEQAQRVWELTYKTMTDENHVIHKRYADQAKAGQTTAEPSFAERLREALLQHYRTAA
jgi:hypothetical protein